MKPQKRVAAFCCVLITLCYLLGVSSAFATHDRFNMSYLYFGSASSYVHTVKQAQGSIDEISPNYFNLNSDGSLNVTGADIASFVSEMHAMDVRVVPFLSNHWDQDLGITALNNREALSDQIVEMIRNYDFDGINVDIENVTHIHRDLYSEFVELLRQKMPQDKVLAVAVAANPYRITKGWHGSYDYFRLAKSADYLMLMSYDEHYQGSTPGPISSYAFMEQSIQYALQFAPPGKIVLGIPFYARIWSDRGTPMNGRGLSEVQLESLISNYRGIVTQDTKTGSTCAKITVDVSDQKPVIYGTTLAAGEYTIFYESEDSKKQKLALIKRYDLRGTGSWSLGQEFAGTWDYYALWLNGWQFEDVQGHWAMHHIIAVANLGIMTGVSSAQFAPERSLTRAEAAVIIYRILKLPSVPQDYAGFSDTQTHWANEEIRSAKYHNLIQGFGSNTYFPDQPVSRQEMVVMLDRALSIPKATVQCQIFPDVNQQDNGWSYDAIMNFYQAGIIDGFPDGTFGPSVSITRAGLATMLSRISLPSG